MTRRVCLGEYISRLVSRGDGEKLEISFLEMLASDVVVNLNVLCAFKEDISGLWSIHVSQEPAKPDKLASGVSKGTILSLSTGTRNHILLLATPRDKRNT